MTKTTFVRLAAVIMAVFMLVSLVACTPGSGDIPDKGDDNMAKLTYPDFPNTPSDKNSWEYIEDGTDITIDWYVDVSTWNAPTGVDAISKKIKEDTGISVRFDTPVTDDGQKLSTIVAGKKMPDVITLTTSNTSWLSSLAQQGYVYDINTLAEKWAPSLKTNMPSDVMDWWAYGNGKTYGIPNHYYSYRDVPKGQLQPNGGMMVRKDLFDAWQTYVEKNLADEKSGMVNYKSRTTGEDKQVEWQGYITTPEGFLAAAKWAITNYKGSGDGQITTGLQLSQFKNDGCTSLTWLAQFFAIPFEDEQGNYQYQFTQESYEEMLLYVNELYNEGVISDANFTQNYDGVGSVIAGGKAFATLVTPQDYQMHFVTAKDSGYEYVTMYITNENGDAPVLADIRGYGYLFNMITTDCERPDLVIKLFDYLTSPYGQRLVTMGVEGVTWNWEDELKTKIAYTDTYLSEKASGTSTKYGLMMFDLLINYQYYDNMQPQTNHGKTAQELYRTNLKRPLTIYSYDYNATHFVVDTTDSRYRQYSNSLTKINNLIGTQVPKIIKAKNAAAAKSLYDKTVATMNDKTRNLPLVIEMNAEAYAKYKQKLGVTIAWPAYQQGYVSPLNRLMPNGDLSLYRGY